MDNGASSYRRYLDGEDKGLEEIVEEYYDGLVLYLCTYVKDLNTAEDMAEETLLKIITKKPKFGEKSNFRTWLYAIGRNTALDHLRKQKKNDYVGSYENEADDTVIEQEYIRDDQKKKLHKAMSGLKYEYRQALWLYYFEEVGQKEIAVIMGKSIDSVKHILARAKEELRGKLESEGIDL